MLLRLREAMIRKLAGKVIAVLMNMPEIFVSTVYLKKLPKSSVIDIDILKTRTRAPNGKRFSERNGNEVVEEAG